MVLKWCHVTSQRSVCSVSMSQAKLERVNVDALTLQSVKIKYGCEPLKRHFFFNAASWLRSPERLFHWQKLTETRGKWTYDKLLQPLQLASSWKCFIHSLSLFFHNVVITKACPWCTCLCSLGLEQLCPDFIKGKFTKMFQKLITISTVCFCFY